MTVINCCSHKNTSSSDFVIQPTCSDCSDAILSILNECPICGSKVAQLKKFVSSFDKKGKETIVLKTILYKNSKAEDFIEKLTPSILYRLKKQKGSTAKGSWYLFYNEYGIKKKCYSNLSSCRLGLIDGFGKLLTKKTNLC